MKTKFSSGQSVFVNMYDNEIGARSTREVKIDSVVPSYIVDEDDGYFEFAEEDIFESFKEAQGRL